MKKHKWRVLVSAMMLLCMGVGMFAGCGKKEPPIDAMTRGEWITLLGQTFGMDEYQQSEPYFNDVSQDDAAFAYAQSAYEWDIFQHEGDKLSLDEAASKEFVAVTALLAADASSDLDVDALCAMAQEEGVIYVEDKDWDAYATYEEGVVAAAIAQQLYLTAPIQEIAEYTTAEGVELESLEPIAQADITVTETGAIINKSAAQELEVGSVFIAPADALHPCGIAKKVVSIEYDGDKVIVETTTPELDDLYESISLSTTLTPDLNNMILAEGVQFSGGATTLSAGQNSGFTTLGAQSNSAQMMQVGKGLSAELEVNFTKGTINVSRGWDDFKLDAETLIPAVLPTDVIGMSPSDDLGTIFEKTNFIASKPLTYDGIVQMDENGLEKVITVEDKYKGGYEITGKIGIENLTVTPKMEKTWYGKIEEISITVDADIVTELKLQGKLEAERSLGILPIAIPQVPGASVDVEFILFADVTGELSVRAEVATSNKFQYNNGKFKKTSRNDPSVTGEFAVELDTGAGVKATLSYWGIETIDMGVKVGVNVASSAKIVCGVETEEIEKDGKEYTQKTYELAATLTVDAAAPVVKFEVGTPGTLANKLKITGSWEIISKDKAPFKKTFIDEKYPFYQMIELEEIESEDESEEVLDEDSSDETQENNPFATLVVDPILISLQPGGFKQIEIVSLPDGETIADVTYTSKNTEVAVVNSAGVVQAVGEGTTQIYIETSSGAQQVCAVTVSGTGEVSSGHFL